MTYQPYQAQFPKEPVYCPVCKAMLGTRHFEEVCVVHCEECSATFTFKPYQIKPFALIDKSIVKKCGCGRCSG